MASAARPEFTCANPMSFTRTALSFCVSNSLVDDSWIGYRLQGTTGSSAHTSFKQLNCAPELSLSHEKQVSPPWHGAPFFMPGGHDGKASIPPPPQCHLSSLQRMQGWRPMKLPGKLH